MRMKRYILVCIVLVSLEIPLINSEITAITEKTPSTMPPLEISTILTAQENKFPTAVTQTSLAPREITNRNPNSTTEEPFVFKSVYDLCRLMGIPDQNCSCSQFVVKDEDGNEEEPTGGIFESLCKHIPDHEVNEPRKTLKYTPEYSRSYATVSVLLCIVGILGNGAVIMTTFNKRKTISQYRLLITELAISDFVFAFLQLIHSIPSFWTNKWIYNANWCKVSSAGQLLGALYSIGFILIIAIERFYGTLFSMKHSKTSKRMVYGLSMVNLILGLASVVPMLVNVDIDELGKCSENWPNGTADSLKYNLFLTIFHYAIPILVVCGLYVCITLYATKKGMALKKNMTDKQTKLRNKKNRRMILTVIVLLIAFTISVLPNRVVALYFDIVDYKVDKDMYFALSFLALVPYHFHLAVNPIIYTAIDKKLRKEIWAVFTCSGTKNADMRRTDSRSTTRSSTLSTRKSISSIKSCNLKQTPLKDSKGRNASVDMVTYLISSSSSPVTSPVLLKGNDDVFNP